MPRVHDRGGWPTDEPIDRSEHQSMDWEHRVNAIRQVLGQKALLRSDELRRGIESIEPSRYVRCHRCGPAHFYKRRDFRYGQGLR